jgi:hypothetical protein
MKVIDVHTHGIGGVDTRSASVDALLRIAEIHGASGVSEIVLSIYPAPIQTMRRQMGLVRKAIERQCRGSSVEGRGKSAVSGPRSAVASGAQLGSLVFISKVRFSILRDAAPLIRHRSSNRENKPSMNWWKTLMTILR